jgi:hypothetical protein
MTDTDAILNLTQVGTTETRPLTEYPVTQRLEFHPFAEVFPLMTPAEADELKVDIKAHGLRDDIVLYRGKILDGRNRYLACNDLHIVPRYVEYVGPNPLAFVVSKNWHRRNLTDSQRSMVAGKLVTLRDGQTAAKLGKFAEVPPVTTELAAKLMQVSPRSVTAARAVRDKGVPELVEAVERGDAAVSRAAKIAELPQEEQAEAVKALTQPKGKDKRPKEPVAADAAAVPLPDLPRFPLSRPGKSKLAYEPTDLLCWVDGRGGSVIGPVTDDDPILGDDDSGTWGEDEEDEHDGRTQELLDWVQRNDDAIEALDAAGLLDLIRQAAATAGVMGDFIYSNERLRCRPYKKDDPKAYDLCQKADGYAQVAREHINQFVDQLAKVEAKAWKKKQQPGKQSADAA